MKGGKVAEAIGGSRKGNYVQIPNNKQHKEILERGKCYVEYFTDITCQKPLMENNAQVTGISDGSNFKFIGFYD